MRMMRRNISASEGDCKCGCGTVPSPAYLDLFQALRDRVGFSLPFTSMTRCMDHNEASGGSAISPHLLCPDPGPYGAADIGIKPRSRKDGGEPDKVFRIVVAALSLGANNIEVCDAHIHIGWVPHSHPMFETGYWGESQ